MRKANKNLLSNIRVTHRVLVTTLTFLPDVIWIHPRETIIAPEIVQAESRSHCTVDLVECIDTRGFHPFLAARDLRVEMNIYIYIFTSTGVNIHLP